MLFSYTFLGKCMMQTGEILRFAEVIRASMATSLSTRVAPLLEDFLNSEIAEAIVCTDLGSHQQRRACGLTAADGSRLSRWGGCGAGECYVIMSAHWSDGAQVLFSTV